MSTTDRCADPLEAEILACHEELSLALQWTDKPIIVELDCAVLVASIMENIQDRSSITHLISEIKALVSGNRVISFVKVDRTQNRASHCLAISRE